MDDFIDSRFERLEKALANLIDSVTKYHPSTVHAKELEAADVELGKGLEQVQIHQNNYLRTQQLRKASADLDSQIRETLSSLAATRKDIVTTHTTTFPVRPNYPIAYEELLGYARRISKTTMPPAGAANVLPPSPDVQTPAAETQPPSATTPTAPTPSQTQSPAAVNGASHMALSEQLAQQQLQAVLSANTTLPEAMHQYLNPLSGQVFCPWPLEDKIRSGALASNQILTEQGIDPMGYDPIEEEQRQRKEEESRKAQEEQMKTEREEREKKQREEAERLRVERERQREKEQEGWRRASVAAGAGSAIPGLTRTDTGGSDKKQFQFTNLDDLDDDEE